MRELQEDVCSLTSAIPCGQNPSPMVRRLCMLPLKSLSVLAHQNSVFPPSPLLLFLYTTRLCRGPHTKIEAIVEMCLSLLGPNPTTFGLNQYCIQYALFSNRRFCPPPPSSSTPAFSLSVTLLPLTFSSCPTSTVTSSVTWRPG